MTWEISITSLVNKTFLSRPRPRPRFLFFIETKTETKTKPFFSQDQGKTFYFEIKTKSKTFCRSSELAAIRNITSTNAVIPQNHKYTHNRLYLSHSIPRLWVNTVIIMSLASICHHYMLSSVDNLSVLWVHCLCKLQFSCILQASGHTAAGQTSWLCEAWRTELRVWINNSIPNRINRASRGHLCDSTAFLLLKFATWSVTVLHV